MYVHSYTSTKCALLISSPLFLIERLVLQSMRETQYLKEQIHKSDTVKSTVEKDLKEKTQQLEKFKSESEKCHQQEIIHLEAAHLSAVEELEGLYEKRLEVEQEKIRQIQAVNDDVKFSLEEKLRRMDGDHQVEKESMAALFQVTWQRMVSYYLWVSFMI